MFQFGALELCLGAKPTTKAPVATGLSRLWTKSNKLRIILFFLQAFMNECRSCYYCS